MPKKPPHASPDSRQAQQDGLPDLWAAQFEPALPVNPLQTLVDHAEYIIARFETVEGEVAAAKTAERWRSIPDKVAKLRRTDDAAANRMNARLVEWARSETAVTKLMNAIRNSKDFLKLCAARETKHDDIYKEKDVERSIKFLTAVADIICGNIGFNKKGVANIYGSANSVIIGGRTYLGQYEGTEYTVREMEQDLFCAGVDKSSKAKNHTKISKSINKLVEAVQEKIIGKEPENPSTRQGHLGL